MHLEIEKIKNMLFYMGLDKKDLLLIKKDIDKANINTIKHLSMLVAIFFLTMLLIAITNPLFSIYIGVYIAGIAISIFTFLMMKSRVINNNIMLNFVNNWLIFTKNMAILYTKYFLYI